MTHDELIQKAIKEQLHEIAVWDASTPALAWVKVESTKQSFDNLCRIVEGRHRMFMGT